MKTFISLTIVWSISLFSSALFAYIPPLDFILDKATATTGRQIISFDQDVFFKVGNEDAQISESWLVEGDRNLKVAANGKGFYKENVRFNALYNSKNRTMVQGKNKISTVLTSDFFEKYLFVRSSDSFKNYLRDLGISSDVRLARADGRVTYAIGVPSNEKLSPQIWIDQDEFIVRKIRLPSEAEITLSDFTAVGDDLYIAKTQKIKWAGVTVTVKVKNISTKPNATLNSFYPQNFDANTELSFVNRTTLTQVIEDFYKRFR